MHYKYKPYITTGANGTSIRHANTEENPILDLGEIDGYIYIYSATQLVGQNELLIFTGVTLSLDEIAELNKQRFLSNTTDEVKQSMQYSQISAVVQKLLDDTAKDMGYDDINSAIVYIGSPNEKYNTEGIALRDWKSDVWTYVNSDEAKSNSTIEELLENLPKLVV